MVLSSAAASTLTTILPTARTTLAMAAHKAIPQKFATIHKKYLTPTWSTVGMGIASIVFYLLLTWRSPNLLGDTISSIGLLIAFYYGLTGFACVWFYRNQIFTSGRAFVYKGLFPFLGGLILFGAFIYAAYQYWAADYGSTSWTMNFPPHWAIGGVFLTGVGAIIVGVILMIITMFFKRDFFSGRALPSERPSRWSAMSCRRSCAKPESLGTSATRNVTRGPRARAWTDRRSDPMPRLPACVRCR